MLLWNLDSAKPFTTKLSDLLFWCIILLRSLLLKDEASTYYSLGALYYNTGRVQEASEMFDKAVKLDPSRADYICSYVSFIYGIYTLWTYIFVWIKC